jgi:cell division transport system ATP-binding protein
MIRFTHVSKEYARGGLALDDVSFHVGKGEFAFLTGPSGAGKSTILKLVYMEEFPTEGDVRVAGMHSGSIRRSEIAQLRRKLGVVFQDFRLLDHLTTFENVALPLRVQGQPEASYRPHVVELLHWVGLGDRIHVLPPVLSGGEKQRAAIARALIGRPELLLADEPTGNVDPPLARRLLRLFVELHKSGTSVLLATHDVTLMDQYDGPRLVLDDGRLHRARPSAGAMGIRRAR